MNSFRSFFCGIGVVGVFWMVPACWAQQGGQSGGQGSSGNNNSQPIGASTQPLGMNLPQVNFGASGGGTSSSNSAARGTSGRGTIGSRTGSTRGTTGLTSGMIGSRGGSSGSSLSNMQMNRQPERRSQYVTRVDFSSPAFEPPPTLELRSTVQQSVDAVASSGVTVSVDGSTVVLTGSVDSANERTLAERMAMLEPGVRSVRNELVVTSSSSKAP